MPWAKWLVRGFVYSVLGGSVLTFLLYHFWTSPTTIRRQVLAKLTQRFPGASIALDAAHLRLFGGIAVGELRLARRDDLDKADFLYVPSAVIYHDKEQLLDGILAVRKVEVFRPRLRIVRERDGTTNLAGLMSSPESDREPLATLVVQQGTIVVEDRTVPGTPLLEIKDVNLTAVNDPLPVVSIEGGGQTDVLGPVRIHGSLRRDTGEAKFDLELAALPLGPTLVQRLSSICPDSAAQLRGFHADGEVQGTIAYRPGTIPALTFDVSAKLHKGEFNHARLPLSITDIEAEFRLVNPSAPTLTVSSSPSVAPDEWMRVSSGHFTARAGPARLEVSFKDLRLPTSVTDPDTAELSLEKRVRELDWKAEHLHVSKDLLDRLDPLKEIQHDYQPVGPVTVTHKFRLEGSGWKKAYHVEPEGMTGEYVNFPYLVENITGGIDYEKHSDRRLYCKVDLAGTTEGRRLTIKGEVRSDGDGPSAVGVTIAGNNIPLDAKLGNALQGPSKAAFNQFHPEGLGDFQVGIYRARGATRFANRFLINIHDATFTYDLFRYRLDDVAGVLEVLPDHWEARDFHGSHGAGEMRFAGRSFSPTADGRNDPLMRIEIHGNAVALDKQFEEALAPPDMPSRATLKNAWKMLDLSGRMSFDAEVLDLGSDDPANLDVKVATRGFSMRPQFFKYDLNDVSGSVHYTRESITFENVAARHGATALSIRNGQILTKPGGTYQTRLGNPEKPGTGILLTHMTVDAALLDAVPAQVRKALDGVNLRGPFDVTSELVVDPQDDGRDDIWWDGTMVLHGLTLQAGIDLTGIQGQVSCCGLYKDQKLRSAVGNVWFSEAALLGQPLHNLHTRFVVDKDSPELLRIYDVGAELFGGQIGGQANLDFSGVPRFELNLVGLQVKLEQFGRFNQFGPGAELEGMAELSLFLRGKVDDFSSLSGTGRLDVPNGKLYRLPPLLDLLKALGLRAPDHTAFERARLEFSIVGTRVMVNTLNLIGSAVSLRGQGSVKIDGSDLNLDFSADPGMLRDVLPVLSGFQQSVSDQLLKIKVRGKLTEPRFEKELIPGVLDPVRHLLGTTK